ncbi:MAG: hypothetical protein WC619_04625 [Patescibacteria group bacterium]
MKIFCEDCQKPFEAQRGNTEIRCEHINGRIISTTESACPDCGKKSSYTDIIRAPVSRPRNFGESRL